MQHWKKNNIIDMNDLVNFQKEFERIAQSNGMGIAVTSSLVCHRARGALEEVFPNGEGSVNGFRDGVLMISFPSSSALARFNMLKPQFHESLQAAFSKDTKKNPIKEVRSTIGSARKL